MVKRRRSTWWTSGILLVAQNQNIYLRLHDPCLSIQVNTGSDSTFQSPRKMRVKVCKFPQQPRSVYLGSMIRAKNSVSWWPAGWARTSNYQGYSATRVGALHAKLATGATALRFSWDWFSGCLCTVALADKPALLPTTFRARFSSLPVNLWINLFFPLKVVLVDLWTACLCFPKIHLLKL